MNGDMMAAVLGEDTNIHDYFEALPLNLKLHNQCVAGMTELLVSSALQEGLEYGLVLPDTPARIRSAVSYHDIGLALIPECLLNKTEQLYSAEMKVMQRHTLYGAKILDSYRKHNNYPADQESIWRIAAETALSHHERWDGRGYPYGQMATAIPITARATAVADAYDSIIRGSPYCMALPHEYAILEITENSGTQFDPFFVKIFIKFAWELKVLCENVNSNAEYTGIL